MAQNKHSHSRRNEWRHSEEDWSRGRLKPRREKEPDPAAALCQACQACAGITQDPEGLGSPHHPTPSSAACNTHHLFWTSSILLTQLSSTHIPRPRHLQQLGVAAQDLSSQLHSVACLSEPPYSKSDRVNIACLQQPSGASAQPSAAASYSYGVCKTSTVWTRVQVPCRLELYLALWPTAATGRHREPSSGGSFQSGDPSSGVAGLRAPLSNDFVFLQMELKVS